MNGLNALDGIWNLTDVEYAEYIALYNLPDDKQTETGEDRLAELLDKIHGITPRASGKQGG